MAETAGSIKWDLDLDDAKFKQKLKGSADEVRGFGRSLESAKAGSFALLGGLTMVGVAAFGLATKSAFTAARTETLGVAMKAVAKATGTSTKLLAEQEEALKKQGITTQEARGTLTRFMQSQLDVADASKIARVAQDLAVISGENSSVTTARLTDAIATMNPILLKQVGLTKNSSEIFEAYGKTIGKTGEDLTATEKKQAMVNYILEAGKDVAGSYELAMDTVGKKMGSLSRYFEEAFNVIGEYFLPILGEAVDALTDFLKQIKPENIERWIKKLQESPEPIYMIAGAIMIGLVPALYAMAAGIWAAFAPLIPFLAVGAALGYLVYLLIERFGGLDNTLKALKPVLDTIKTAFDFIMTVVNKYLVPALLELWGTLSKDLLPVLEDLWKQVAPTLIPALKWLAIILGGVLLVSLVAFIQMLTVGIKAMSKVIGFVAKMISVFKLFLNHLMIV